MCNVEFECDIHSAGHDPADKHVGHDGLELVKNVFASVLKHEHTR